MSKKLQKHLQQTMRQFKKQKRKEFKALREAIDEFNFGCAYLPKSAYLQFTKARKCLNNVYEDCKHWWKKA